MYSFARQTCIHIGMIERLILEFENREHSYRMLIRQLAVKCSMDVTFPVYWL